MGSGISWARCPSYGRERPCFPNISRYSSARRTLAARPQRYAGGNPPAARSSVICAGGWRWASRNRSTNRASMAAGSWLTRWYRVASGRLGSGCFCRRAGRSPCALPRACRPGWRAPGHGAVGHDRPDPRGQGQCRRRAASPGCQPHARPAPAADGR